MLFNHSARQLPGFFVTSGGGDITNGSAESECIILWSDLILLTIAATAESWDLYAMFESRLEAWVVSQDAL